MIRGADVRIAVSPILRGAEPSVYMYQFPSKAREGPVLLDGVPPDLLVQSKLSASVCLHRPHRLLSSKLQLATACGGGGGFGGGIGVGAGVGPNGPTCSRRLGDPAIGCVTMSV